MDISLIQQSNYPDSIKAVQIIDLRGKLPVNPKYTWKTYVPKDGSRKSGVRSLGDIKTVVLHHDGMAKSTTAMYSDLQLITNIAKSHINSKRNIPGGDPGAPYHMYVRNGKLYILNDVDDYLFGVSNNNGYTCHVCVGGNYADYDSLTDADRAALYAGVLLLEANMPAFVNIKAHRELDATACPGYDYSKVRNDIDAIKLAAAVTNTPNDAMAKVYATKTRLDDLYKTATGTSKYNELAQKYLLKVNEFMKKENLL